MLLILNILILLMRAECLFVYIVGISHNVHITHVLSAGVTWKFCLLTFFPCTSCLFYASMRKYNELLQSNDWIQCEKDNKFSLSYRHKSNKAIARLWNRLNVVLFLPPPSTRHPFATSKEYSISLSSKWSDEQHIFDGEIITFQSAVLILKRSKTWEKIRKHIHS